MLEFNILDKNFVEIGTITDFDTLIWDRRYFEPGEFELYTTSKDFNLLKSGRYICRSDNSETAIIEYYGFGKADKGSNCFAKGRMIEALLDSCIVDRQTTFAGNPETIIREVVQDFVIPKYPKITLGKINGVDSRTMEMQVTGDNVLSLIYEIAKSVDASVHLKYDYYQDTLTFEVVKGLDRREDQTVNTLAVFSDFEGSAETPLYDHDDRDYKNVAYVAGEGEGNQRTVVKMDLREDQTTEEPREVWIDARDIQKEDGMTDDEYKRLLLKRGIQKMAEHQVVESVEVVEGDNKNLIYRRDYDIGDLATYINEENGLKVDARITEALETMENNTYQLDLNFGAEKLTKTERIIKGVV